MAQEWAKPFYNSKAWQQVSSLYMSSKAYICERCGGLGEICHHKKWLTPENINDLNIALGLDNLECLCRECHNIEHMLKKSLTCFDEAGNVERVKDSREIAEYKRMLKELERAGL